MVSIITQNANARKALRTDAIRKTQENYARKLRKPKNKLRKKRNEITQDISKLTQDA